VARALAEMTAALHPAHPEERPVWRKPVRHNRFSAS